MLNFVIPGIYISNDSKDSEIKNTIRVLGEDDEKENYFKILGSNKSLNEDYILDNYTFMSTSFDEKDSIKHNNEIKKSINIGDLNSITANKSINNKISVNQTPVLPSTLEQNNYPVDNEEKIQTKIIKQESPESIILKRAIDKVKTDSYQEITFNITLRTNCDIEKLTTIANLMDININDLIGAIIDEPINKQSIVKQIVEYDFNKTSDLIIKNNMNEELEEVEEELIYDDEDELIEEEYLEDEEEFIDDEDEEEFEFEEEFIDDEDEDVVDLEDRIAQQLNLVNKYK